MTKQTIELDIPDGYRVKFQREFLYKDEYYLTEDGQVAISPVDEEKGLWIILEKVED